MKIKTLTTTFMTFLFMVLFTCCAFAETYNSATVTEIRSGTQRSNDVEMSYDAENYGLKNVTMDQASSWFEKKEYEVIGFLQKVVQPLAIIVFIVCGLMILFGNVKGGSIGAGISLVIYVAILYAPEIFYWFLNWIRTG